MKWSYNPKATIVYTTNSGKGNGPMTKKEMLEKRYKGSTNNLLAIAIFSLVNLVLLVTNADRYFLFSAYMPYLLGDYAMFFCGKYPAEEYKDFPDMLFLGNGFFTAFLALAAGIIAFYVLCFVFARKNKGAWLIFGLSLFSIDTLIMFAVIGFSPEMVLDVFFHGWIIVSLARGTNAFIRLKKEPSDIRPANLFTAEAENSAAKEHSNEELSYETMPLADERAYYYENSPVIRTVNPDEKAKVFVEADYGGHHIAFRRAKRVNELVIDGRVYKEYEVLAEGEHSLTATIDGREIKAYYDGKFATYIFVDGKEIAKKARFF